MLTRCYNESSSSYPEYGGRGIQVCERWRNDPWAFFEDMGKKPNPKDTVDRIDVNGDYTPENCRWADTFTQARNTRVRKDNNTGVRGVQYKKDKNRYIVSMQHKGAIVLNKKVRTFDEAVALRKAAEAKYL